MAKRKKNNAQPQNEGKTPHGVTMNSGRFTPGVRRAARALLPACVCFFSTCCLLLIWYPRVPIELLFAPSFVLSWFLTRRLRWDDKSLLGVLCGFLAALALPHSSINVLMFIAFVPLFLALENARVVESLCYGLVAGGYTVFLSGSYYVTSLTHITGSNTLSALLMFLPFSVTMFPDFAPLGLLYYLNASRLRLPRILFLPACVAALELGRFELYPWHLGIGLTGLTRYIQMTDIVGTPGLSFVTILLNVVALDVWKFLRRSQTTFPWRSVLIGFAAVALSLSYGEFRLRQIRAAENDPDTKRIAVAIVQPNSPYHITKEDTRLMQEIADTVYTFGKQTAEKIQPDLIVFPEGAGPISYHREVNPVLIEAYRRVAREVACPIVVDNVDIEQTSGGYILRRSALLLSPDGQPLGEHFKHKLVPFGEYIPFSKVFPSLKRVFRNANPNLNTQPGTEFQVWTIRGVQVAVQVCFEILYPNLARRFVNDGARLIINSANDGWYQDIGQTEQHLALGIYRCIENRVPMVRATNTGVSAYISAAGEIQGTASPFEEPWADCRHVAIPELSSFYRRFGDVFGIGCVLFVILAFVRNAVISHKHSATR